MVKNERCAQRLLACAYVAAGGCYRGERRPAGLAGARPLPLQPTKPAPARSSFPARHACRACPSLLPPPSALQADPAVALPGGGGRTARELAEMYGHSLVVEVLDEYREQVGVPTVFAPGGGVWSAAQAARAGGRVTAGWWRCWTSTGSRWVAGWLSEPCSLVEWCACGLA